jgi:predicted amidophosphoribosyltransferase
MAEVPRWTQNRTRCRHCGVRWGQSPLWLCRQCDRVLGSYVPQTPTTRHCRRCGAAADTRESLCTACWQIVAAEITAAAEAVGRPVEAPRRERVIRGRTYVVVWDGTGR